MATDEFIKDIFEKNKTIAVYGMSTNPSKPAHYVPLPLKSKGFSIIPINPNTDTIADCKCYPNLKDVEERIDILEIFRPSDQALDAVREAIERRKTKGDINVIWLQLGIQSDEARRLSEESNITFIENRCMKQEYQRLFSD
ncbi:MAG: CoA-binding protein [Gemmatimonadota bacterium]|nr:MAG: CoA-binding protein [Gemmatimonadota bacterium]